MAPSRRLLAGVSRVDQVSSVARFEALSIGSYWKHWPIRGSSILDSFAAAGDRFQVKTKVSISVSTNQSASKSILGSVATHEKELLAKLESSRTEARNIVDQARTDARQILADADATLTEEMSAIRRQREASRQAAFDAVVREAESRLAGVRAEAASKVESVADQILSMFVPKTDGNN